MIVLDASAVIEMLLQTPAGGQVEVRITSRRELLHAPHLIDLEVTQVFRRLVAASVVTRARGREALEDLRDIPLVRHSHTILLDRIWQLRDNFTAYDAAYVALAEELDAPLLTCDRKLAAPGQHRARIEVI